MFLVLKKNYLGLVFLLVLVSFSPSKIRAMESLTIKIDEGTIRALSLGIVPIRDTISTNVFDIVADNLKLSGRFDIFNQADILSNPTKFEEKSNTDKLIPEGPIFSIKPLSIVM